MAAAIEYLGGNCSFESCAHKMGLKVTGGFTAIVGSARKHELVDSKKETLTTTELYRKIKLAYDENEKNQNLRIAFLSPPLYKKLYEKFKDKELPIQMLDKLLIREFGVEDDMAQRVSNYFIDGARSCNILVDNKIIDIDTKNDALNIEVFNEKTANENGSNQKEAINNIEEIPFVDVSNSGLNNETYIVHILGPGINSRMTISEQEDFLILDAMISKLRKKIKN